MVCYDIAQLRTATKHHSEIQRHSQPITAATNNVHGLQVFPKRGRRRLRSSSRCSSRRCF